jgi:hypothetical protein
MASTDHLPLRLAHHHSAFIITLPSSSLCLHHHSAFIITLPSSSPHLLLRPVPLKTQFILLLFTQLGWSMLEISANSFPP